jgi:predicted Zn finger-like uncharacterized protein
MLSTSARKPAIPSPLAPDTDGFYKAGAMILSCPACKSGFLVSATLFAHGPREVRCARCANIWCAEPPPELSPPSATVTEIKTVMPQFPDRAAEEELPSPGRRLFVIGVLVLLAALLGWFVFDRTAIERDHPWLAGAYDRLGLHVYQLGEGLVLEQVHSELQFENGLMQLVMGGRIRNDTAKTQEIPDLLAVAMGPDGKPMQSWQIDAPAAKVAPGEALPFQSVIRAPKGTVTEINLNFTESPHAP